MKNKSLIIILIIAVVGIALYAGSQLLSGKNTENTASNSTEMTSTEINNTDGSNNDTTESTETTETTPIKVGMSGSYKPYTYLDESGTLTGFDVEVWQEIAKRTGREVEFVTSDFSGLFGMLDVGQIDTIANQITITDERLEKYDFSVPYVYYGAQLMTRVDDDSVYDLETLKGKKVGVSLGSNYETMVKAFDTANEITVVTYDSGSGAYQDLSLGRIDAVLNDKLALLSVVNESGLNLKLAGEPIESLTNAFPFVKSEANGAFLIEVNQAIEAMYADGTMKSLSLKYFNVDITER